MPHINPTSGDQISRQVQTKTAPPSGPNDVCLNPHGSSHHLRTPDPVANACQDFEAVLVSYMLKTMRESVPEEGLLGNDNHTQFYRGLMDWEIANQASHQDRFGLWKVMYRQITGKEFDPATPIKPTESANPIANTDSNHIPGGPNEIPMEGISDNPVRGTGSGATAVPAPENPGVHDTP